MSYCDSSELIESEFYNNTYIRWRNGDFNSKLTKENVTAARKRLAERVRHHTKISYRASQVIKALESCAPYSRCLSAACPECTRALQRWLVREGMSLLCQYANCDIDELPGRFQVVHGVPILADDAGFEHLPASFEEAWWELWDSMKYDGFGFCIGGLQLSLTRTRTYTRTQKDTFTPIRRFVRASLLLDREQFLPRETLLRTMFPPMAGIDRQFITYPFDGNPQFFEDAISDQPTLQTFDRASRGSGSECEIGPPPILKLARLAHDLHRVQQYHRILVMTKSDWAEFVPLRL